MVVFICSHCGASLKKNKVEKHYAIQCRNRPHVSCMDCHKEFSGNDYAAHTKCITEDEKYSGKGFVPKPVASKQEEWLNIVRTVRQTRDQLSNNLKSLLDKIISFENIPRKKPKFMNFLNNNHLKFNLNDLDLLWDLFEKEQKRVKESVSVDNAKKAAETESKDSSMEVDKEPETSPKKKKKRDKSESKSQVIDDNEKDEAEEMESEEVTPPVETKKNKDKKKQKSDAVDDGDIKVSVEVQSEEAMRVKKAKKKKNKLEGTKEAVNINDVEEPAEMQAEEITQGTQSEEITRDTQPEEVTLTKKQRKEKKKKEKYEAELEEIENSQPIGTLPEDDDDEQNKGKKKSKRDKHVIGLDNNVNGISERKAGENVLKAKKKRSFDDDSADTTIERKKKKGDIQDADQTEETAVVDQYTIPQQKFNWNEIILEVVKSKGGEIPVKRLRKKVLSEFVNSCGSTESEEKLGAKFSKKLQKVRGITIHKEVVMLV